VVGKKMDKKDVDTEGRRISDLLNEVPSVVAAPKEKKVVYRRRRAPKKQTIAVIRGLHKSDTSMEQGAGK
jgi:hypothetical protein